MALGFNLDTERLFFLPAAPADQQQHMRKTTLETQFGHAKYETIESVMELQYR